MPFVTFFCLSTIVKMLNTIKHQIQGHIKPALLSAQPKKENNAFEGHVKKKKFSPLSTKLCSLLLNTRERIE